jgi:group II intron reverse transcriptase/maturase
MSLATPSRIQQLQRKLYRKSKAEPDFRFYTLWDKVCRSDVLEEAWRRVKANKGAGGVDGETIQTIEKTGLEKFLATLQGDLKAKTYVPLAVRRVWIPKAKGGKRPLGIPTVRDRVVQTAVKVVLEPILEATFLPCSFGFRPKRSAHDAVREVSKFLNWGLVQVVDADIRDFFRQIPRDKLMRVIAQRVADGQILRVIRQWLGAGVMEEGRVRYETTGTPQGGVISPLLSNAYLNELDRRWEKEGSPSGKGWDACLVRYADDLVILTDKDADRSLAALKKLLAGLGLELHPDKTRLVDANKESFDFLGFNFRKAWNQQKTKRFALVLPSRKTQQSIRDKIRALTRRERALTVEEVVQQINPVIRGWVNYFRIGHSSEAFGDIRHYTAQKVRRYLRCKQQRQGFGWKQLTDEVVYGQWKLFRDYRLLRPTTAGGWTC